MNRSRLTTLSGSRLFCVDESKLLQQSDKKVFHSVVHQGLGFQYAALVFFKN